MVRKAKTKAATDDSAGKSLGTKAFSRPWLVACFLAVITLLTYAPALWNGFVNYDDGDYVTSNPHVQSGLNWENILWAFKTGHASNWHPLTWISHMLDCQLFGQHPGPHHLVNVVLHVANAILLFFLCNRLTSAPRRSALVAALFALHPLHVESVAWISERKDVLSTLFFLLTLIAYARYAMSLSPGANSSRGRFYFLALLAFALGLMSKPMLVTTPFILLLLDYWPLERWPMSPTAGAQKASGLLLEKVPFLLLSLASSIVTFLVQQKGGSVSTVLGFGARLANAAVSYGRYLAKTFWPAKLSVLYPHPGSWPWWQVLLSVVLLAAITVLVLTLKRRWLIVGWLWFVGTLVPVIGLVQVGIQSMADRYAYIPSIGLFIAVAWSFGEWLGRHRAASNAHVEDPRRTAASLLAGLALGACALLTFIQVHYWRDSGSLFGRAVQATQNNYLAYNNLGFYLSGQGKIEEALENYRKSVELNPNYEDALNNLGYALVGLNRNAEAIPYYEAALRIRPRHTEVHNNLGNALSNLGRLDEAIAHYQITLEENPKHADAHNNLGIALAMQGKLDQAIPEFEAAIRFKPSYASAHSNLGNAFAAQHKFDEAIREYRKTLELKPDDAQAYNNLGNALAEQGKLPEAVEQYRLALQLNANNPEANFNLGVALVRQGNQPEAAKHLREALRLKPDYDAARKQLQALSVSP